jgi:hypothetical protein
LLGEQPGKGRVLVLTSVPSTALRPISEEPLAYGFRMRMVARSGARAVEVDSVRHLGVHQRPGPADMVTFTTEVPVDAGAWTVGVALEQEQDSAGETLRDSLVPVPDGAGRTLAMSDIVLGDATGGRAWKAPDGDFPLSSTGSYAQGEPVPIYYEIAGAGQRGDLETEITFVRDDGKGRSVIRFSERLDAPVLRVHREVNTAKSEPGRYTLTVRLKTPDNRRAERETSLIVTAKGR